MPSIRRTIAVRLGLFLVAVAIAACADSPTQPVGAPVVRGAHRLSDDDSVTNWDDTLTCTHGWLIVNAYVECGPS